MSPVERSSHAPARVEGHGGRVARCPRCASFTYDVTGLSDEEVRRLVLETEGRVLTRLVARRDGRVMSVDCGHGTVAPPSRWPVVLAVVLLGGLVSVGVNRALAGRLRGSEAELVTQKPVEQVLAPVVVPEPVVPPPVVESPPTVTPTATPVPRAAAVHLAATSARRFR